MDLVLGRLPAQIPDELIVEMFDRIDEVEDLAAPAHSRRAEGLFQW